MHKEVDISITKATHSGWTSGALSTRANGPTISETKGIGSCDGSQLQVQQAKEILKLTTSLR